MTQRAYKRCPFPFPNDPPEWITAFCVWGDCILSLGIAQECRRRWPDAEFGLVYAGRDEGLYDWLQEQRYRGKPLFARARRLYVPMDDAGWWQFVSWGCCEPIYRGIVDCYLEAHGIDHTRTLQAHVTRELQTFWQPVLAEELTIGGRSAVEAVDIIIDNNLCDLHDGSVSPYFLCLPFSHQSTQPGEFWPATRQLMKQLPKIGIPVLVAGLKWGPNDAVFDGTIDIRDRTSRNDVVFALAERSAAVICQCNSLAHYCAAAGVPCVVLPNKQSTDPNSIFRVALEMGKSVKIMGWKDSARTAMKALREATGK